MKSRAMAALAGLICLLSFLTGCSESGRTSEVFHEEGRLKLSKIHYRDAIPHRYGELRTPDEIPGVQAWRNMLSSLIMTERGNLPFTERRPFAVFTAQDVAVLAGPLQQAWRHSDANTLIAAVLYHPDSRRIETSMKIFYTQAGWNFLFDQMREPRDALYDGDVRNPRLVPQEGQSLHKEKALIGSGINKKWLLLATPDDAAGRVQPEHPAQDGADPDQTTEAESRTANPPPEDDVLEQDDRVRLLDRALQAGLLTEEEYQAKKKALTEYRRKRRILDEMHQSGLLTDEEHQEKLQCMDAQTGDAP